MTHNQARRFGNFSLEVTARSRRAVAVCAELLAAGTNVYIAFIPGDHLHNIVKTATELQAAGLVPVPHLAARSMKSFIQLDDFVSRLAGEAGVEQVLLIGGDANTPLGPYASSLELMQNDLLPARGIVKIGFAVHPEGHPTVPDGDMDGALRAKLALAANQGLQAWLVSQFCFTAGPIIACLEDLRAKAITAPLRVGLAGPSDRRTLMKYALRCGIRNTIKVLGTRFDDLHNLAVLRTPDDIVSDLASTALREPDLSIEGLHLFPFGNIAATVEWKNHVFATENASA